jgi:hypothetical protein
MVGPMGETVSVECPWCGESIELWVDADGSGQMIEDCEVCCRPWLVSIARDEDGGCHVSVTRS